MDNSLMEKNLQRMVSESIEYGKTKFANHINTAQKAYFESTGREMPTNLTTSLVKNLKATQDYFEERGYRTEEKYLKEVTAPSDINAFIHYAFDMITAILPSSIIEEFATIQGMDKRIGEVFFMDIIKTNAKAPAVAGSNYLSSQYGPNTGQNYTDERVLGEQIDTVGESGVHAAAFTGTIVWPPVKSAGADSLFVDLLTGLVPVRAKFYFTTGAVDYVGDITSANAVGAYVQNVSTGANVLIAGIVDSAVIATSTGICTITFSSNVIVDTGTYVTVSYEYDSTNVGAYAITGTGLPEVDIKVSSRLVYAKRRALKTKWLLDSAAMLAKEHGKDVEKELLDAVIAGVMNEIAVEAAADIYNSANAGTTVSFSKTPPSVQIPYIVHRQELLGTIIEADTQIETAVRKVKGNFIIGGSDFSAVVKGMPVDMFSPSQYATAVPVGIHVIGTLNNQYKCIQNFDYTHDTFVVGAKGNNWLTTGYIYAPFIPLMTTKPIVDENLVTFRSLLTYYGKLMVNSKFYNKGLITA